MALAQVGPLTALFEGLATAVGGGMVLGGFGMGIRRLAIGQSRKELEAHVLTDGYGGGLVGMAVALVDLLVCYCL